MRPPHLLLALSSHGFGHLSQAAPVVNQLRQLMPTLQITVRGAFPEAQIRRRIPDVDVIEAVADDFGMVMHDALHVDTAASLQAYEHFHLNWAEKVKKLSQHLHEIKVDLVLADIPYLPLAAAQTAGIPCVALCSLNWADILEHYLEQAPAPHQNQASKVALIQTIRRTYQAAQQFLQPTPSMPMPTLTNTRAIGPVCSPGMDRRDLLTANTHLPADAWIVLVGMGGMPYALTLEHWPHIINHRPVFYLVPEEQKAGQQFPHLLCIETTHIAYPDLIASVDLIITKPGYGMFAEAAAAGVPVLYVDRPGWPEAEALTDWLNCVGKCVQISSEDLKRGTFMQALTDLLAHGRYPPVPPTGNLEGAMILQGILSPSE